MLFNSYAFLLVFLPAAIIVYALADPYPRLRMPVLIALSLVFYSYWDVRFLPLHGRVDSGQLARREGLRRDRHAACIITAAIVGEPRGCSASSSTRTSSPRRSTAFGLPIGPFAIALPLGISFFTFHHIMYLVDLRRGKAPEYPLDRYALYIAFFPQAIAGPLARWSRGDAPVRPAGLRAGLAAPIRARRRPSS